MQVRLIAITQPLIDNIRNCEELIEYAGRKCTATTEKTENHTYQFIRARLRQGHTSILEHVNFTFEIDGISRACLAQLTRHRIGFSYSVESQRCVKQRSVMDSIIPESILQNEKAKSIFNHLLARSDWAYTALQHYGIPIEDARMALPLAAQTNLVLTANLRSLQHFFDLRLDKAAQWEIRELATRMKEIIVEYCPSV